MTLVDSVSTAKQGLMEQAATIRGRSLWQDATTRFLRNKAAMASVVILALIGLFSIIAPWISPHELEAMNWEYLEHPPTFENSHWFGTDDLGRDQFVRVFYGARISLTVAILTTAVALSIGILYGATAGFFGGRVDQVMMRIVDVMYALPGLFFIIIIGAVFGRNLTVIFLAIAAFEWLTMARIVRGQTLSVKRKEYIEAARAAGLGDFQIILRHILPNTIGPVIVFVTLLIPVVILIESYLSFIGLGVQEPLTSWGLMISQGANKAETAPWLLLIPAGFLAITLFCFNFIGDGLRDALDPKDR